MALLSKFYCFSSTGQERGRDMYTICTICVIWYCRQSRGGCGQLRLLLRGSDSGSWLVAYAHPRGSESPGATTFGL